MVGWEPFLYNWSAANNIVRALPLETVTISEPTLPARQTNKTRIRNELAISVGDSITNQRAKNRTTPTETVLIDDLLNRIRQKTITINEVNIDVSDVIDRLTTKARALTTETVFIDDLYKGQYLSYDQ